MESHHHLAHNRQVPLRWILILGTLLLTSLACTTLTSVFGGGSGPEEGLIQPVDEFEVEQDQQDQPLEAIPTDTESPDGDAGSAGALVGGETLDLQEISSTTDGEISGPILRVEVINPSNGEVVAEIPCGLIFEPVSNPSEQRLMTIQSDSATVAPGGSAELNPYVICIDGDLGAPASGSTYQVGQVAAGQLGDFAQCLCQQDLEAELAQDFSGGLGLQFAIWMTSEDRTPEEYFGDMDYSDMPLGEGEFSDTFGEEFAEMFAELQGIYMDPAIEWLERCGIQPGS